MSDQQQISRLQVADVHTKFRVAGLRFNGDLRASLQRFNELLRSRSVDARRNDELSSIHIDLGVDQCAADLRFYTTRTAERSGKRRLDFFFVREVGIGLVPRCVVTPTAGQEKRSPADTRRRNVLRGQTTVVNGVLLKPASGNWAGIPWTGGVVPIAA